MTSVSFIRKKRFSREPPTLAEDQSEIRICAIWSTTLPTEPGGYRTLPTLLHSK
jgi:hypothetical protein